MAAADLRGETADYAIHETNTIVSRDYEDHTFCGIMFSVSIKDDLPMDFLEIECLAVRGHLGPLTVWVTEGGWEHGKHERRSAWTQIYSAHHAPSPRELVPLELTRPVRIRGGSRVSFYVHSALANDRAIVYDDQRYYVKREDDFLKVEPGLAHLCNEPFGSWHPWGSWRRKREFVGSIKYGVRYLLWNPVKEVHTQFNDPFKDLVNILLLAKPRADCPLSWLSEDCIFYILNMCRYDWVAEGRGRRRGSSSSSLSSLRTRLTAAASRGSRVARALIGYATI